MTQASPTLDYARPRTPRRPFPYWHEVLLLVLLIALFITTGSIEPRFMTLRAQLGLTSDLWPLALLALPMTLIIITGGIDLSVGSTMALASVVLGISYKHNIPLPLACLLAVFASCLCGLLNGFFIAKLNVHPLIVTLATFSAFRGIAEGISLGEPVSGFPDSFQRLAGDIGSIPLPGILFLILAAIVFVILSGTPFGTTLYAIGYNETAVRFAGHPVRRTKVILYTFSALTAGIASILYTALRNTAKADVGTGLELDVITAVVLGGTSIFGGRGTIPGTLLGILLIHETEKFVSWHYHNNELILIVVGALLILSVLLNTLLSPRRR
jgi:rhamnose transport system permease protein